MEKLSYQPPGLSQTLLEPVKIIYFELYPHHGERKTNPICRGYLTFNCRDSSGTDENKREAMLGNPYGKRDAMLGSKDIKNWEARKANQTTILPSKIIKKLSGQEAISKSGRLKRNFRQAVNYKYPTLQNPKMQKALVLLCFHSQMYLKWAF